MDEWDIRTTLGANVHFLILASYMVNRCLAHLHFFSGISIFCGFSVKVSDTSKRVGKSIYILQRVIFYCFLRGNDSHIGEA